MKLVHTMLENEILQEQQTSGFLVVENPDFLLKICRDLLPSAEVKMAASCSRTNTSHSRSLETCISSIIRCGLTTIPGKRSPPSTKNWKRTWRKTPLQQNFSH